MRSDDPTVDLPTVAVTDLLPKALSEEETARLLGSVVGAGPLVLRDRALLEVLYGTGARVSEVVGLSLGDVAGALEAPDLPLLRVLGKGNKERVVPLGTMARSALADWLSGLGRPLVEPRRWQRRGDAEAVFLNARGGRLSRAGAFGVVKKYAARVDLADRVSPTCSGTPAPPTCSGGGRTSAWSKSSWATRPWPPPSATPRCRPNTSAEPTRTPTPGRAHAGGATA